MREKLVIVKENFSMEGKTSSSLKLNLTIFGGKNVAGFITTNTKP